MEFYVILAINHFPVFKKIPMADPYKWPKLSIIVPACNEATHIESAVNTLLEQDYPNLEIILINDRSSDETPNIVNTLAQKDQRIQAIHIDHLPDGWLGKVHALHQGVQLATGDWYLFTDADVHFAKNVFRKAIAIAEQNSIDHLTLAPRVNFRSYWLELPIRAFGFLLIVGSRALSINDPKSDAFVGIGAFNLVRSKAYKETKGFEWLSLEAADDPGLGFMLKSTGHKSYIAAAYEDIWLDWYPNLRSMFKGVEKNLFGPTAQYSLARLMFIIGLIWSMTIAPIAGLMWGLVSNDLLLIGIGSLSLTIHLAYAIFCRDPYQYNWSSQLFMPIGMLIITMMMIWAAFKCLKNDGIDWRGTHYSLAQLKRGQRVKF